VWSCLNLTQNQVFKWLTHFKAGLISFDRPAIHNLLKDTIGLPCALKRKALLRPCYGPMATAVATQAKTQNVGET
jgi:hypothetical protein